MGKGRAKRRKIEIPVQTSSLLADAYDIQDESLELMKAKQLSKLGDNDSNENSEEPTAEALVPVNEDTAVVKYKKEKISLVDLKSMVSTPELIEWHDTHAPDPIFLAQLKTRPGVVQVPSTWQGRDFRGKFSRTMPYQLPKNIYDTGIAQQRNVFGDADEALKEMAKNRVQPKLNSLDLDYRKLHAAFFKFQERPHLYSYGQVYHDGMEFESDFDKYRPGHISTELRNALGLSANEEPPWIAQMEKHGFPPAYGDLRQLKTAQHEVQHWGIN